MAKNQTLLEQAKQTAARKSKLSYFTDEHTELVLAWVRDEITMKQLQSTMKFKSDSYCYVFIARVLREDYRKNGK